MREELRGGSHSFNIDGDFDRVKDKQILGKIIEAGDSEFWSKGPIFVNTEIMRWIRAYNLENKENYQKLPDTPNQDKLASVYGLNAENKIDRLSLSDQQLLRDRFGQRQIYGDVREAFDELRSEGQRLGDTLAIALDRMLLSMPKVFEDAQAYLVWRDGNRLRRLYLAHRAVAATRDPDPARLEPAIAEQLGGALDLFNLFAMGDDGLRAKDEATIPFQERASAETEAALARPVVTAMLDTPEIFTEAALGDLRASLDDDDLPKDDPYDAQTRVQTNKTWRNITAALFSAVRTVVIRGPQFAGKEVAKGALAAMGSAAFTDIAGVTHVYGPMIEFVATNAPALSAYAATAFSNYRLDVLIDAVVRYFRGS